MDNQNPHNINLDISQTTPVICEECGHTHFQQVLIIRKASGFLTGTGKPTYIPIPVFACTKCNHVNSEFAPKEFQNLD